MKPCSKNRKLIVWLTTDALPAAQAGQLREHIRTCAGCRAYFEETVNLVKTLSGPQDSPIVQSSPAFHRRVVQAIAASARPSPARILVDWLRPAWPTWRFALPILIGVAVVSVVLFGFRRQPDATPPTRSIARADLLPLRAVDLPPTFANYQMAAEMSPDALDELVTAQARRNPVPAPLYTPLSRNVPE